MSKQVLSIEQMKHLHELGLDTSQASMVLLYTDDEGEIIEWEDTDEFPEKFVKLYDAETGNYDHSYRKYCGVFTLQDILNILPKVIEPDRCYLHIHFAEQLIFYGYEYANEGLFSYISFEFNNNHSIIDAAYEMLCWCIENGYVGTCCS